MSDARYLQRAIDLSAQSLDNELLTPFGAVLVIDGRVVGEGVSEVVAAHDPTAHAEVMALRHAGSRLATHLFPTATMYCSSQPCPLCLAACMWAQVPQIIFAASTNDVALHGFEDLWFYREIALSREARNIREVGGDQRDQAVAVLDAWARTVPGGVLPKV